MAEETTTAQPTPSQETVVTADPNMIGDPGEGATTPVPAEPTAAAAEPVAATVAPTEPSEPPSPTEPEPADVAPEARVVPKPSEYVLPEGTPDQLRIFAHEKGFSQDQLDAALQQFGGYVQGSHQAEQKALKEAGETQMRDWGDQAQTNLSLARQALKQNDPGGKLSEVLESSGYGNHPVVLEFLRNIGKSMQEGGFLKSTVPRPPGQKTAAEAMYGDSITSKK